MAFDRAFREPQFPGNLLVEKPACHEFENLVLTLGKPPKARRGRMRDARFYKGCAARQQVGHQFDESLRFGVGIDHARNATVLEKARTCMVWRSHDGKRSAARPQTRQICASGILVEG